MTSNVNDKTITNTKTVGMAGLVGFLLFILTDGIFNNLSFRLTSQLTYWEFHPMTFRMIAVYVVIVAIASFIIGYYVKKTHPTTNSMIVWGMGAIILYILNTLYLLLLTNDSLTDFVSLVFMPNFYSLITSALAGYFGAKFAEKFFINSNSDHLVNNGQNDNTNILKDTVDDSDATISHDSGVNIVNNDDVNHNNTTINE